MGDIQHSWRHVNFGTGKVIFLDVTRKDISVIHNFDWAHPAQQYETAETNPLPTLLTKAVYLVEKESRSAVKN